jgi:hypothetical protein
MKNAYEIRLDVLSMAHGDLVNKFQEKLNFHRSFDADGKPIQPSEEIIDKLFPKADDILKRAEELYAFVSEK